MDAIARQARSFRSNQTAMIIAAVLLKVLVSAALFAELNLRKQ
jgi:hypothetical protein